MADEPISPEIEKLIRESGLSLWSSYCDKKMQVENLHDLLREILNSDMAQREEDEGEVSPLLEKIRAYLPQAIHG